MDLITWNIQWGRGIDGRVDLARVVAMARAIADFDVLCLQEVADNFAELAGNDGADQFAALAALLPGYVAIAGPAIDLAGEGGRRRRYGNMILSRLPVSSVRRHALPWPTDPRKSSMARMALEAVVHPPSGPLRVTTTHLEYYSDTQRLLQARYLREMQEEACGRVQEPPPPRKDPSALFDLPTQCSRALLCGDFNCPPDSVEYGEIQSPLRNGGPRYRDAWRLVHGDTPHPPTFCLHGAAEGESPYCCDFVFMSEDLPVVSIAIDGVTQVSDHQPVHVRIG